MSVVNELTSEVAAFMLKNEAISNLKDTRQVLLVFHAALQSLSLENRRRRTAKLFPETLAALYKSRTSPTH